MKKEIGRFQILKSLGRGGMSTVYLAHDPITKREVAIKLLSAHFLADEGSQTRFRNEAQIVAGLEHPAIVPLYEFGEDDGQPYLVMRNMVGGALTDRLRGPMPLGEIQAILSRICPALDRSHQRGVIHRDIKPDNVLFDEDGLAYLADFGIARLAEANKTMTIAGTPAYMSPEQVTGDRKLDGRSDIYALGVMLYQMLSGRPPYEAETPTQLMMKHVLEPIPNVLEANPALPLVADALIRKAMAKSPEERHANGAALVRHLTALWQSGTPAKLLPDELEPFVEGAPLETPKTAVLQDAATPPTANQPQTVQLGAAQHLDVEPTPSHSGRTLPTSVWLGGAGLLLVVLAVLFGPGLLERGPAEPTAGIGGETAVVQPVESGDIVAEPANLDPEVPPQGGTIPTLDGGTIGLSQSVTGQVVDEKPQVWRYEGEAATVDIQLESDDFDSLALLVFPPGFDTPEPYVDFAPSGEAELLTFYDIVPGTEFGVRDTANDGATYRLSVSPSDYPALIVGSEVAGEILGPNAAIFEFTSETAVDVDIILQMGDKDTGLLIVYDVNGGNPDNWLYLATEPKSPGVWQLENIFLESGKTYRIFVRDSANDGSTFELSVTPAES